MRKWLGVAFVTVGLASGASGQRHLRTDEHSGKSGALQSLCDSDCVSSTVQFFRPGCHYAGLGPNVSLIGRPCLFADDRVGVMLVVRGRATLMCLQPDGRVAWATPDFAPDSPQVFDDSKPPLDVLWSSPGQDHLWVNFEHHLAVFETATGKPVPVSGQLTGEWENPEADPLCLMRSADQLGLPVPPGTWRRDWRGNRWLDLGRRARRGDPRALADLRSAIRSGQMRALQGLALLGPQTVRPELLTAMRKGPGWESALALLGKDGEPILLETLQSAKLESDSSGALVGAARYKSHLFWKPLEKFSLLSSCWKQDAAAALLTLRVENRTALLLETLETPHPVPISIARYFQAQPCAAASPLLLSHLRQSADAAERAELVRALQSQNRVDFGFDVQAWERWLAQGLGRPAAVKARLLEDLGEPTAILWRAQLGELQPAKLLGCPRLQAMWPTIGILSPDGRALLADLQERTLPDGLEFVHGLLDPASGRPMTGYVVGSGTRLSWHGPWHAADGKTDADLGLSSWKFQKIQDQSLLFSEQILDLETLQTYPIPSEATDASPVRSETLGLESGSLTLFDWRKQQATRLQTPFDAVDARFSADGEWMLVRGQNRWRVLDRQGRTLFQGDGRLAALSPGRDCVMLVEGGRLQRIDLKKGLLQQRAWAYPAEPYFLPAGNQLLAQSSEARFSLLDSHQLAEHLRFWGPPPRFDEGYEFSARRDGKQFALAGCSTMIWRIDARVPDVPVEKQPLLSELWTGMHLNGGMAVRLTPAEYAARVRRWQEDGGGSWYHAPGDLRGDTLDWSRLAMPALSTLGICLLGLWRWRWEADRNPT